MKDVVPFLQVRDKEKNLKSRVEWNTNCLAGSQLSSLLLSGRASYRKILRSEVRIVLNDSHVQDIWITYSFKIGIVL